MRALLAFALGVFATAVVITQTRKPRAVQHTALPEIERVRTTLDEITRDIEALGRLEQQAQREREEAADPRFFSTAQLAAGKKPTVH